jgi:pyruvate-formate lyase-activating enzyme
MRVSLNSARQAFYEAYYRPRNYCFADVRESILCMKKAGRFVSLNYFVLPGFTDSHQETAAFMDLIEQTEPNFIQLRNLNIDPEWYLASVDSPPDQPVHSVRQWLKMIKKAFPSLRFGYYNPCLNP